VERRRCASARHSPGRALLFSRPASARSHRSPRRTRASSCSGALADDPDQGDDVVGFHVQQTVEKSVKAVLAAIDVEYPRTHDIDYLVRQLAKYDISVPDALLEARWVSLWGVFTRYDDLETVLDRPAAIDVATVAIEWAHSVIGGALPE
jgi:HEPN domain-containing protein